MARLSINEMTTYRWSFEEDVVNYRAAGIPAIGVWRQKLSDFGEEKGVELLAESGLAVSNLLWAGGFTGSDGRNFRESLEDAADAIRLAGQMRAGCLIVYSGGRAGHTHNHARRLMADALRELAPQAEEADVTLAIEPMHAASAGEWTFLTELDDTLSLVDKVGSSRVQLVFDTYHFGDSDAILERLPKFVNQIAIVHLGDRKEPPQRDQNRVRLGDGTLPLAKLVSTLAAAGYDKFYDVELIGEDIEATDYNALLEHSQKAYRQLTGGAPSS